MLPVSVRVTSSASTLSRRATVADTGTRLFASSTKSLAAANARTSAASVSGLSLAQLLRTANTFSVAGARQSREQPWRYRDGIAIKAQIKRRNERYPHVTDAEAGCDRNRRQQMRGIEQTEIELVANIRPRHLAHQFNFDPLLLRKAHIHCDQQRSRVDQRDITDAKLDFAHLNISAAVSTDCAISTIFLFSFMAVLRNSA